MNFAKANLEERMKTKFAIILSVFLLTACIGQPTTPQVNLPPTATLAPPATETPIPVPTFTETPAPTATPRIQINNEGKTVVFDFTAQLCEAKWVNGAYPQPLPCPGDLNNVGKGYIGLLSGSDQGLALDFPMILAFPAYDNALGLFGRYPKFTVGANDEFRATLTCRSNAACFISFALGYYDANGKYHEPFPMEYYKDGVEPPINYVWPIGELAGQTVEFVLAVRNEKGDPLQAWGLWISPRIVR